MAGRNSILHFVDAGTNNFAYLSWRRRAATPTDDHERIRTALDDRDCGRHRLEIPDTRGVSMYSAAGMPVEARRPARLSMSLQGQLADHLSEPVPAASAIPAVL